MHPLRPLWVERRDMALDCIEALKKHGTHEKGRVTTEETRARQSAAVAVYQGLIDRYDA